MIIQFNYLKNFVTLTIEEAKKKSLNKLLSLLFNFKFLILWRKRLHCKKYNSFKRTFKDITKKKTLSFNFMADFEFFIR